MSKYVLKLYEMLDKTLHVRITVCFLPGLILTNLAAQFDLGGTFKTAGSLVLLIGGGIFVGWRYISSHIKPMADPDAVFEVEHSPDDGIDLPPTTMGDLVAACGNDQSAAMMAMLVEREIFPHLSTDDIIALAVYRKQVEKRLLASSTPSQEV